MVDAHEGAILVQSDGKDQGSTFTVRLKNVPAPVVSDNKRPALRPSAPRKSENGEKPTRVLVVDDHQDTCMGMKMMLERRGYQITVAHSADQAVEKASQEYFDLLISDIGLPDRSGYELMQELRTSKGLRGIALSGFGMEDDIRRAHEAGFSEHLRETNQLRASEEAIRNLFGRATGRPFVIQCDPNRAR